MSQFSVVFLEQDNSRSFIAFELNKLDHLLKIKAIGEFVKSSPFELNFYNSIGVSKWEILLFPNGQYDCNGKPDSRIFVYLKMMSCEKMSMELKLDVKVQLGTDVGWELNQRLCFRNAGTRWTRIHLVNVNKLKDLSGNSALISLYLTEHLKNSVSLTT